MAPSPTAPSRATVVSTDEYARRFGALLRRSRRKQSMGLRRLASKAGPAVSVADLRAYEQGEYPLDPQTLQDLCTLYGIGIDAVLPDHSPVVIDLEQRELRIGTERIALSDSPDPATHLRRYVEAVGKLRSRPMTSPATLRRGDTEALAEAFELDVDEVVDLLSGLMGEAQEARRRVIALRAGASGLAAVVVVGAAATALQSRSGESETVVLSATEIPGSASAEDNVDTIDPIPDSETFFGPNIHRSPHTHQSTGSTREPRAEGGDPPVEDETNIDAPGGPVVIERDDHDGEDETNIDAPGGPIVIERSDQDDEDED